MKRSTICMAVLSLIMAVAFSVSSAQAQNIEWSAGSVGGSWFSVVTGLSRIAMEEIKGLNIRIVPGGGRDNPTKIAGGISQLAMGVGFLSAAAYKGEPPYKTPATNLRTLGSTWMPAQYHVIVPADEKRTMSEIFSDPKIRIATAPKATSESLTLVRVLEYYKNPPDSIKKNGGKVLNLSYSQLVSAFLNSQIDVLFGGGAAPTGMALEIEAGRRKAKVIAFPEDLIKYLYTRFGYGRSEILSGTYKKLQPPDGPDLPVSAVESVILADAAVPEDLIYKIMMALLKHQKDFKNIYSGLARFDPKRAWQNPPVPLHPGAERAYRELGYMK